MLTSKEIIERTGLSRATLNNYIAGGLLPRPQVLPPGPEHGAAPRIGYFPDDTIERIEVIQRLKREGWSITRIAEHFAGHPVPQQAGPAAPPPAPMPPPSPPEPEPQRPASIPALPHAGPRLTPGEAAHPAYLVNDGFRLAWMNEDARHGPLSPLARRPAGIGGSVLRHLLDLDEAGEREALLRFHLEAAKARGLAPTGLLVGLLQDEAARLESLYHEVRPPAGRPLVAQLLLPPTDPLPARWIHAIHFQEGVVFALQPQAAAEEGAGARGAVGAPMPPRLTPVAVLVGVLQDAAGLWVRLSPEEYFELLNEVGAALEAIFTRHGGRSRRPAGEVLVGYFLPQAAGSYLWNALAAAHQAREAMRQVSQRWQVRKGWDVELAVNVGIDEGQDWLGALGGAEGAELRVLGDAADRADHLSRAGRGGAVLLTRSLVGKLSRDERQRLTYGVRRLDGTHGDAPLLFTFARLAELVPTGTAAPAVAGLAVAELLDLNLPASPLAGGTRE